jgi:hypothetical protein
LRYYITLMNVTVLSQPTLRARVSAVVKAVNAAQRYYRLSQAASPAEICAAEGPIDPVRVQGDVESHFAQEYVIAVVCNEFEDNWFSHESPRSAVITTHAWEQAFAPPSLRAYITYQVAQALINFAGDLSEDMLVGIAHSPPRGCMFDMNEHKPDIKLGMVSGWLCLECEGYLRRLGTPIAAINSVERILKIVRQDAIGKPREFDPDAAFIVMRFSTHDENDNAYRYGIRLGIEDAGLTAVRGDSQVESGQILDKVRRFLDQSRFIVAKVDENNLNVYFELGLALGAEKEVLLISETSLVMQLPSDLRNWECLTYPR